MVQSLTPYCFERNFADLGLARISMTCCSVNLDIVTAEPFKVLPLEVLSAAFAAREPRNKCDGLTHFGLSHL
jgi:hypothetical protein